MFKQITIISALVLHATVFVAGFAKAADTPDSGRIWTLEELLNLAQQRSANSFEASYAMPQFQDGQLPLANECKFETHVIADLKTPRFSLDIRRVTPAIAQQNNPDLGRQKSYWDPNSYVEYHVAGRVATIDGISPATSKFRAVNDPLLYSMLLYPPEPKGYGFNDGSLISLLRFGVVHKGTEKFDGRQCCVVDIIRFDGTLLGRAWLDLDRSLAPLQLWDFANDGKSVNSESHSRDLVELSSGGQRLWVPIHVDKVTRFKDAAIRARITVDKDSAKLDPVLSDTMFRPEFPAGTQVQNRVGNGTHVTMVRVPKVATPLAPPSTSPSAVVAGELGSGWGWVIWATVSIVAALATLFLLRLRWRVTSDR
jgi:hypothetical protein